MGCLNCSKQWLAVGWVSGPTTTSWRQIFENVQPLRFTYETLNQKIYLTKETLKNTSELQIVSGVMYYNISS